jgi:hypothetical protein
MKRIVCALLIGGAGLVLAQAHRLTVVWVCDGEILEIRSTAGTEPIAGAELQLRDASGELLAEGLLDASGRYRWPWNGAAPITIEINAGLGHRRTLTLTEEELKPSSTGVVENLPSPASTPGVPGASGARSGGSSDAAFSETVRVGLGLTFLLSLAAAWMGYRNSRRLANLERRLDRHEG